jgi:hypothetical protein
MSAASVAGTVVTISTCADRHGRISTIVTSRTRCRTSTPGIHDKACSQMGTVGSRSSKITFSTYTCGSPCRRTVIISGTGWNTIIPYTTFWVRRIVSCTSCVTRAHTTSSTNAKSIVDISAVDVTCACVL